MKIVKLGSYYSIQFFAVFFLFEFLPSPVNFHVLLVTGDHFCLDGVGSI